MQLAPLGLSGSHPACFMNANLGRSVDLVQASRKWIPLMYEWKNADAAAGSASLASNRKQASSCSGAIEAAFTLLYLSYSYN